MSEQNTMNQEQNAAGQDPGEGKSILYKVNGEDVKLSPGIIRRFLVSGNAEVTDQEVTMFLQLCRYQKLNPYLKEAYLVKYKNKQGPDKPAQIITSKEAFMKRAESNQKYRGLSAGIIVARNGEMVDIEGAVKLPEDKLIGGWAKVIREDRQSPITVRISLEEFSKGQATWNQMPMNMIRKVAVVNALREAFPDALGALYTEDEGLEQTGPKQIFDVQQEIESNANQQEIDIQPKRQELPKPNEKKDFAKEMEFNSKNEYVTKQPERVPVEESPSEGQEQEVPQTLFEDNPPF